MASPLFDAISETAERNSEDAKAQGGQDGGISREDYLKAQRREKEAINARHRQTVNELKVSDTSYKPQIVMGLAFLVILVGIIVVARFLG